MLTKRGSELTYSDVTPKGLYMSRRNFLLGFAATGTAVAGWKRFMRLMTPPGKGSVPVPLSGLKKWPFSTTEAVTPINDVTHYNNFYEFGTGKEQPAENATGWNISNWSVSIEGEVKAKRKFTMDEILKLSPLEERIYRHRCVEAWSIVVPWIGYPLSTLLKQVEPTEKAKFVAFESYYNSFVMPQAAYAGIEFPYVEGLRLDEAMNPLTLLCVGMYGETLPNQDGAPVRLVVPWKYGFKSIKSLVKIKFVKDEPPTTWNMANAHEYGFYSNVNPNVDHPRWSQAKERRLGEFFRRPTLMFNGYSDQVAAMYAGMDLRKYY